MMEFYMINLSYIGLWLFAFLIYLINLQIKKNIEINILHYVINTLIILFIVENFIVVIFSLSREYEFSVEWLSINALAVFIFLIAVGIIYRISEMDCDGN